MRKLSGSLGETSVLVQSGQEVYELPLLVRRIRDSNELNKWMRNSKADNELKNIQGAMIKEQSKKMSIDEEYELISGFSRCYNSSSIFTLLQTIPITEITPQVASHALKKVFELENNFEIRNPGFRATIRGGLKQHTFQRQVFVNLLLDIVCSSKDPTVILNSMQYVVQDRFPGDQELYKARLLEEVLVCVMDGVFSLQEICKAIKILSTYYPDRTKCQKVTDLFWAGILHKSRTISAMDTVDVVTVLPHLTESRKLIIKYLVEKTENNANRCVALKRTH